LQNNSINHVHVNVEKVEKEQK